MSDYKIISALNEEHKVYLVQSELSGNIYVRKSLMYTISACTNTFIAILWPVYRALSITMKMAISLS